MADSLRSDAAVPCLRSENYHDKEEASTPAVVQCRYGKARPLTMEEVVERPLLEYTITSPSALRGEGPRISSTSGNRSRRGSGERSSPCHIGSSSHCWSKGYLVLTAGSRLTYYNDLCAVRL